MTKKEIVCYLGYECEVKTINNESLFGVVGLEDDKVILSEEISVPIIDIEKIHYLKS